MADGPPESPVPAPQPEAVAALESFKQADEPTPPAPAPEPAEIKGTAGVEAEKPVEQPAVPEPVNASTEPTVPPKAPEPEPAAPEDPPKAPEPEPAAPVEPLKAPEPTVAAPVISAPQPEAPKPASEPVLTAPAEPEEEADKAVEGGAKRVEDKVEAPLAKAEQQEENPQVAAEKPAPIFAEKSEQGLQEGEKEEALARDEEEAAEFAAQQATKAAQQAAAQVLQERVPPPRRAASARASQTFKAQAEYFDASPPDSPIDEPPVQKKLTPKAKPVHKPAAKSGNPASEQPPQKQLALKLTDVNKSLTGKWLQLYWPDDGKWWPGQVLTVDARKKTVTLLYETGEEEANLELADLIRKGEVAWLHPEDMPKEKEPPRRATYVDDDSEEEEAEPATTGRGRKRDEEEAWVPGQKRRAALKSRARFRDESDEESSYSESPAASDQSSDWHSSEDDDKPRRKPKKKKKKLPPRQHMPQPQAQAQPRQGHVQQVQQNSMFGRGGIFDDNPPFGGGLDQLRMPAGQHTAGMNRDALQGAFQMDRGWGVMGGAAGGGYRGAWPGQTQDLNQLFQNRQQQMNNGGMGHLHLPQVRNQVGMQGAGGLDLSRLGAGPAVSQQQGLPAAQWRAPGMSSELMGAADWAQLSSQAMFRLPQQMQQQLAQQQLAQQQLAQQQLAAQRLQQQQQQQGRDDHPRSAASSTRFASASLRSRYVVGGGVWWPEPQEARGRRQQVNLGGATKNMEGLLGQGLAAAGKQVEVQKAPGQWAKATIVACLARPSGSSVMICYDDGRQEQLLASDEGRTFNIRQA